MLLEDIKRGAKPVRKNASASLWDIGDGVLCLEFTSKSNSIDDGITRVGAGDGGEQGRRALVIYNEGANFSVGANLGTALFAANIAAWGEIEKAVGAGQAVLKAMKYAPFPVVAACSGMALGGGCEILLHSDAIQAHAESYIGLVECGVGLVPGWGGSARRCCSAGRAQEKMPKGPMPVPSKVFEIISVATTSKSAAEAKELLFLRPGDGISMNRDRLLADAKARALNLAARVCAAGADGVAVAGDGAARWLSGWRRKGSASAGWRRRMTWWWRPALATVLTGGEADLLDSGRVRISCWIWSGRRS